MALDLIKIPAVSALAPPGGGRRPWWWGDPAPLVVGFLTILRQHFIFVALFSPNVVLETHFDPFLDHLKMHWSKKI